MREWMSVYLPRLLAKCADSPLCRVTAPAGATEKTLYLTFDDGPTSAESISNLPLSGTLGLLGVLQKHGVPATFFLLGRQAAVHRGLVGEILAHGHELANHGWAHLDGWREPASSVLSDFQRAGELLSALQGQPVKWCRPPFGHLTLGLVRWCRENAQRPVLWDCIPPDYEPTATLQKLDWHANKFLRPGSIVCLHDNAVSAELTPAWLENWLPRQQDAGWRFKPLPANRAWMPTDDQSEPPVETSFDGKNGADRVAKQTCEKRAA